MTGVCDSCEREVSVRSTRGSRLADARCPHCGGPLHGKTKGRAGVQGGYVRCVICGARRKEQGRSLRRPAFAYTTRYGNAFGQENVGPHPAGAPCCAFHTVVPAGLEPDLPPRLAGLVAEHGGLITFTSELQVGEQEALAFSGVEPLVPSHEEKLPCGLVGHAVLPVARLAELAGSRALADAPPLAEERIYWPVIVGKDGTLVGLDVLAAAVKDRFDRVPCLYSLRETR